MQPIRAARHGRSAEEEHRRILREALRGHRPSKPLKELLLEMPNVGEDRDFERPEDLGPAGRALSYLLDTNVIPELRKGERADANVTAWFADVAEEEIFLSVLTIGEIRRGIESVRRRDPDSAAALDRWLNLLSEAHGDCVVPVDRTAPAGLGHQVNCAVNFF